MNTEIYNLVQNKIHIFMVFNILVYFDKYDKMAF